MIQPIAYLILGEINKLLAVESIDDHCSLQI